MHTSNEDISIDIVEEENMLVKYTDDHFIHKLNRDLEKIREAARIPIERRSTQNAAASNSPIMMSANNSDSETEDYHYGKRYTFREVSESIHKYYDAEHTYTTELDVLTAYLKLQKNIYSDSATITLYKMHMILLPAFVGTASITVFSPMISVYSWSGSIISGMNAFVFLLYFSIYYFRFLPALAYYGQISKQFEKIENITECAANKYGFLEKSVDKYEYVLHHLREIEKKYMDLKDILMMHIPVEVTFLYRVGYRLPIFSFIKRMETYKKNLIVKLKDIKNEVRYIEYKCEESADAEKKYKMRLDFLLETKEKLKGEIMNYCNAYGSMEDILNKERNHGSQCSLWNVYYLRFMHRNKKMEYKNPVIKAYCESIFSDD